MLSEDLVHCVPSAESTLTQWGAVLLTHVPSSDFRRMFMDVTVSLRTASTYLHYLFSSFTEESAKQPRIIGTQSAMH